MWKCGRSTHTSQKQSPVLGGKKSLATKSAEYALRQWHWNKAEQYKKHYYRYNNEILYGRSYSAHLGREKGLVLVINCKVSVSLEARWRAGELLARNSTEDENEWRKRKQSLDYFVMRCAYPMSWGMNAARGYAGTAKAMCFSCRTRYLRTVSYLHWQFVTTTIQLSIPRLLIFGRGIWKYEETAQWSWTMCGQRDSTDLAETGRLWSRMCFVLGQQKTVKQYLKDFAVPGQNKSG